MCFPVAFGCNKYEGQTSYASYEELEESMVILSSSNEFNGVAVGDTKLHTLTTVEEAKLLINKEIHQLDDSLFVDF